MKCDFYKLLKAFYKTYDYLLVAFLVMLIYALFGVFFFKGALESRCRLTEYPVNGKWPLNTEIMTLCGSTDCPKKFKKLL